VKSILIILTVVAGILAIIVLVFFAKWEWSEDLVSGIVYDNTNNMIISGNTKFKIRASENMYADENTSRTYCLPPWSPYIDLVKRAAADKRVKVTVSTSKAFQILLPWQCMSNVKVEELR